MSYSGVTREGIEDEVDKGVPGLAGIGKNEGTRIDSLSQTSA
jgi:hypothetical protein